MAAWCRCYGPVSGGRIYFSFALREYMCVFCCSGRKDTISHTLPNHITTNHHGQESSPRIRSGDHICNHRGRFEPRASVAATLSEEASTGAVSTETSSEEDCFSTKDSSSAAAAEGAWEEVGVRKDGVELMDEALEVIGTRRSRDPVATCNSWVW